MTGLIKSGAAGFDSRVRPFAFEDAAARAFAPPPDPEISALRERVLDLEAALAERGEVVDRLTEAAEVAYGEGEAAGREAGRAAADDRSGEALAQLKESADRAVRALEDRLQAADRLAALLAQICLDRMFGDAGARADMVCGLIRRQIEALRREAVLEISVSAEDFASAEAAAAAPACAVTVSDALQSGDCTIRLQLGALDIGLGQQWGTLRAALETMVDGGVAA